VSDASTAIEVIRSWIDAAERIVVLTGAGISTESGIPDFRGPKGVWTLNPAAERTANLQYYMSDPAVRRTAWKRRLDSSFDARQPNAGHRALVHLEKRGKLHALLTQNIDRLHHKAGSTPEKIVELHGNALEVVCMSCDERAPMERALARVRAGEEDPPCRSCGGILKSATISFGQSLVAEDIRRAERAAVSCDLLLAIGSTLAVFPAAGVVPIAKSAGARVVILNAEPTEMDSLADAVVRGQIGQILPVLVGEVEPAAVGGD
jgi:NAD-dependent deacetylase